MALSPGSRLGPYEVVAVAGSGGMGEVYRARDTRLDRTVAIKLLPPQLAIDPQFRERFDREARVISKLTHANICTLYDVGDATPGGPYARFLVMEYLEGDTLAARLARGRLPVSEALRFAVEIARALDHAHRHGIVHRDLKPGNVMITKSGTKLLDFGLAAAQPIVGGDVMGTATETMAAPLTTQGTILGTLQYMAPEQVEGGATDTRSDIFALGGILYEMLTGRPPFQGDSAARLLGAILKDDPAPLSQLQPTVPPALDHLVRTCLAKDPDARFQSAHDVLLQLQWIAATSDAGLPAVAAAGLRRRRVPAISIAAAALAAALGVATTWWLKPAPVEPRPVTRWEHLLPANRFFSNTARHVVALSPDGTKMAYIANRQLFLRRLDRLDEQPLLQSTDSGQPNEPVFAPDGNSIVYLVSDGRGGAEIRKIALAGGAPVTLGSMGGLASGASWRGNRILIAQNVDGVFAVRAIPDTGGTPQTLVAVDGATERAVQPQLLDDERHILFSVPTPAATGREFAHGEGPIVIQAIGSSERKVLVNEGLQPRVIPPGYLVYLHQGTLFAARFDASRLAITGETVPVLDGVAHSGNSSAGQFAISDTGTLAYVTRIGLSTARQVIVVDRQGSERPMPMPPNSYQQIRLSPDRSRFVLSAAGQIWTWTFATQTLMQLTNDAAAHWNPAWAGDSYVVYDSSAGAGIRIMRKSADGAGAEELLADAPAGYPNIVTPDGKHLIYHPPSRIAMLMPIEPRGAARPLLPAFTGQVSDVELSPDRRWIAYESNESGRFEVYVRPFPAVESGRWQASSGGGQHPLWSRDGRELFFITADGTMMAVPVQPGSSFSHGRPAALFPAGKYFVNVARNYDVTPDGKGFLMVAASAGLERQSIVVVTNWFEELRAKMRAAER